MGKPTTIGQAFNLLSVYANNTDWGSLDSEVVQEMINDPLETGKEHTFFLKNGGRIIAADSKVIKIDRSKPFDPVSFIDKGWSIEEQDERSLVLFELDLTKVRLETMLRDDESSVKGEEKLRRLKEAGYIRLDARILQTLWEKQYLIPEKWKERTRGCTMFIYFDGTVLRDPYGHRCVLYLFWDDGRWFWDYRWLEDDWYIGSPSALLASS